MKVLFALIMAIAFQTTANADASAKKCELSATQINADIKQNSAQSVYRTITRDGRWHSLLRCIATGEPDWVRIDSLLTGYADGHYGEELDTILGEALGNRPADVLRVTKHDGEPNYALDVICSVPDVEDTRFDSYDLAIKEINRREQVLSTVKDKDLLNDIKDCRGYLEEAKKQVANDFGISQN